MGAIRTTIRVGANFLLQIATSALGDSDTQEVLCTETLLQTWEWVGGKVPLFQVSAFQTAGCKPLVDHEINTLYHDYPFGKMK